MELLDFQTRRLLEESFRDTENQVRVLVADMVTRAVLHDPPDETSPHLIPKGSRSIQLLPGKTYHTLIGM
jgi:hypothetical protein